MLLELWTATTGFHSSGESSGAKISLKSSASGQARTLKGKQKPQGCLECCQPTQFTTTIKGNLHRNCFLRT
jgi:hypothetical protein